MLVLFQQSISMTMLPSLDVQAYLPHRYPFLLVDKVLAIVPDKTITAIKNVTINEPFFQGHFEKEPIMPGVLIIEAMAQATAILASYTASLEVSSSPSEKYVLVAADGVRFKRFVLPGDQLRITAETKWKRSSFLRYKVQTTVDDQVVCEGQITITKKPSVTSQAFQSC